MVISTKGRYALRVMIDLAEQNSSDYIPLKDIAQRQDISLKYLESIMSILAKANFVASLHGKGGGYKLSREANSYTVGSILKLTEGSLSPVSCLQSNHSGCDRAGKCRTLPMWKKLDNLLQDFFEGITLESLVMNPINNDFVI